MPKLKSLRLQGLDADALAALVAAVEAHAADSALPFGDVAAAAPGTAARRTAARPPRRRADQDSDSDTPSSSSEVPCQPSIPG